MNPPPSPWSQAHQIALTVVVAVAVAVAIAVAVVPMCAAVGLSIFPASSALL